MINIKNKYEYSMYIYKILKGLKKVGRNNYGLGAKGLGLKGETSRHQIWEEMTGAKLLGTNWLATTCYRSVLSFNYCTIIE